MITKEQLEARKKYVGGSDAHHLLGIEPYGCERYLWYDKRGHAPDYDVFNDDILKRGNRLEKIILDEYKDHTGYNVRQVHRSIKSKQYSWAMVHLDGEIVGHKNGPGVLECKSVGRHVYYRVLEEGIPSYWIAQIQYSMLVTGRKWASIAFLWADNWQFKTFDIERDDEMIDLMVSAGEEFWRKVENGPSPDRLDPKDKRCSGCAYRTTCQGALLMSRLDDAGGDIPFDGSLDMDIKELKELEKILSDSKELVDTKKEKIKELVGDRTVVDCTGYRIHYKPIESNRLNSTKLKKERPDIYNDYVTKSVSRPFKTIAK